MASRQVARRNIPIPGTAAPSLRPTWAHNLSDREYVFVEAYLKDLVLYKAAIAAGVSKNCSSNTSYEWMQKAHIREAVDSALAERFSVSKSRIIEELAIIAFSRRDNIISWDAKGVKIKDSKHFKQDEWAQISGIKMYKDGSVEVKFEDRQSALERLAKVTGIMRELPPSEGGNHVSFVIGDPEVVLARYREKRQRDIDGRVVESERAESPGEHTDLVIVEPRR